jgi:hypothetical protein
MKGPDELAAALAFPKGESFPGPKTSTRIKLALLEVPLWMRLHAERL